MNLSDRARQLGTLVARVQSFAASVAGRSRTVGFVALGAAPVAWLTLFGRWAFDSLGRFVLFLVVLAALAAPGLMLVTFAAALRTAATETDEVFDEVAGLVREGGGELVAGVGAAVSKPGLRQFGSLLGSLWKLRDFRGEFGSIVAKVVTSTRLLNPIFLGWVALSAAGAGVVMLLAVIGLVVWAA